LVTDVSEQHICPIFQGSSSTRNLPASDRKLKSRLVRVTGKIEMLETLNITFKPTLIQKSSRIKIHNALALPILLHGSEILTLRQKDKNRLTPTEMKFFRRAGCTLFDHKRNEEIFKTVESRTS
jgi:hypothetical protein